MAYINLTERARIWNSLDDNLREQVTGGKLSWEEAADLVVPIGDVELQTMREQYPTRPAAFDAAPEPIVPADRPYSSGDALTTGMLRGGAGIDTFQMGTSLENVDMISRARQMQAGEIPIEGGITPADFQRGGSVFETASNALEAAVGKPVANLMSTLAAAFHSEESLAAGQTRAEQFSGQQIAELRKTRDKLAAMPINTASKAFIESVDAGDYWSAVKNAPAFAYYSTLENAPSLAVSGAIVGGTAAATRNPLAVGAAARVASGVSALSELNGDYESIVEGYSEADRNDPAKLLEAYRLARKAVAGRMTVEALIPGSGYGKVLPTRIASLFAGQAASESGAEYLAAKIKGQDVSTGELVAEAVGGFISTGVESAGTVRSTLTERAELAELQEYNRVRNAEQFEQKRRELDAIKGEEFRGMSARRAEEEADRAIRDLRDAEALARGEQIEMPIGSDMAGDPLANDRVPTITDMFSGESRAAPAVQRDLDNRVPEDQMPEETDEAFEIRQQRTTDARNQIDARKQRDFEAQQQEAERTRLSEEDARQAAFSEDKAREEQERNELAEDQTILKNERSLLSTADITREAKNKLAQELEGVRRQRAGIARTPQQMDAILKAYERKRLPELVDNVRNRRLERINAARARDIARDNAKQEAEAERKAAEEAQKKFITTPRTDADRQRSAETPLVGAKEGRNAVTELLPGVQLKKAQTYTAKGDVAEREQQDLFESEAQERLGTLPPKGTQAAMDLPQGQDEQGVLFTGDGTAFRGTLTDEQRAAELARRVEQRRTETRSQRVAREKVESEAKARQAADITENIPTVEKAIAQVKMQRASLTTRNYGNKERRAIEQIVKEELDSPEVRTEDEVKQAVALRLAQWRAENPRPKDAPPPKTEKTLVDKAKEVKNRIEGREKGKQSRAETKELERLIKEGATPEEAAAALTNRRLTPEEDAAARAELGEGEELPGAPFSGETHEVEGIRNSNARARRNNSTLYDTLKAIYESGGTPTQLLDAIANDKKVPLFQRALARRLSPLMALLDVKLAPAGKDVRGGIYRIGSNSIELVVLNPVLVLHEALHAALANTIRNPQAYAGIPGAQRKINRLKESLEYIRTAAIKELNDAPLMASGENAPAGTGDKLAADKGPLSNIDELLSYFMTEPSLQFMLDQGSAIVGFAAKVQGWAKAFYRAALDAIGMPSNFSDPTLLQQLMQEADELLSIVEQNSDIAARIARRPAQIAALAAEEISGFDGWFGGSKVVNEDGSPKIMYHGTSKDKDFTSFKVPARGSWFTDDPEQASEYAKDNDSRTTFFDPQPGKPHNISERNTAGRVIPVYLSIKNPFIMTPGSFKELYRNVEGSYAVSQQRFFDKLRAEGYDGVQMDSAGSVWVAFSPTQIKSAISNRGTFDPKKTNILHGEDVPDLTNRITRRNFLLGLAAAGGLTAAGVSTSTGSLTVGRAGITADLNAPLTQSILDTLYAEGADGNSLISALNELATTGPASIRKLARDIARVLPTTGVDVYMRSGKWNMLGMVEYIPGDTNPMKLSLMPETGGADIGTLLHEALHLAVMSRYLKISTGMVESNWETLGIPNPSPAALRQIGDLWKEFSDAALAGKFGDTTKSISIQEAMRSPDEFFVRALTDPEFQKLLAGYEYKGKTLLDRFKDWVKTSLFGTRSGTAPSWLDAALEGSMSFLTDMENVGSTEFASRATARSRLNRLTENADAETPDFTNPTTRREYYELTIPGTKIKGKILKEIVSFGGGAKALLNALTAGAIKHAPTTRAIERAQSSAAALTRRADKQIEAIDSSIAAQARAAKKDPVKLREEFTKLTDEYEQMADGLSKKTKAKEISDKFGRAARNYFDMRRSIDDLSRAILRERLNDPTPLTEAEVGIYGAIKKNIGTYYTRIYATTIKDVGEKHSKKLLAAYLKITKGKKGTADDIARYNVVKDGVRYIADHLLFIPDADTLEDMSNTKLNKLAKAWGISLEGISDLEQAPTSEQAREYLIERLTKFANANQAARDQQAYSLVEGMLLGAEANSSLTDYYRGAKLDRTVVTEREHVPEEIRKLLGEYEDKFVRGMSTIVRQGEFLARMQMLNTLRETERGVRVLSSDEFRNGGFSEQDWTQIKGPSAGALQDMWLRNDLAAVVDDSQQMSLTMDKALALMESNPQAPALAGISWALTRWQRLAGKLKALALVYNPMNVAWNFMGGPAILLSNGNLSVKHTMRAWKTAIDLIRSQRQGGVHNEEIEKVIRAGITDSAFMGDIKASEVEQLRQSYEESAKSWAGSKLEAAGTAGSTAKRVWREFYAMADVVWKIANFYAEEEFITKLYKAEGMDASPQKVEDAAAWRTNNTNFSYKRVPNVLKMTEKLGLTYIAPYMYETLRAPIASFATGVSDIAAANSAKTPEGARLLRSHGTKRAFGAVLALGGIQATTFFAIRQLVEMMGRPDDEDEEWIEDLKALLPDYKSEAEYEYLGRAENGNPVLIELSRGDPFGPATELYGTIASGDPQAMWDKFASMWINNPFGTTVVQAALGTGSTSTKLEQYDPWSYEQIVKAGNLFSDVNGAVIGERFAKIVDTMIPSLATRIFDPSNVPPKDMPQLEALTWAGLQFTQVDAAKTMEYRAMDFERSRDETRRALYSFLETSVDMTDEQLLERYTSLQQAETDAYEKMSKLYNGMLKLGYEPAEILGKLKEEGLTEADLYAIGSGTWTQGDNGVVSESGIERNFTSAVQRAGFTPAQHKRYYDNIQRLARLAAGGQIQVRE